MIEGLDPGHEGSARLVHGWQQIRMQSLLRLRCGPYLESGSSILKKDSCWTMLHEHCVYRACYVQEPI